MVRKRALLTVTTSTRSIYTLDILAVITFRSVGTYTLIVFFGHYFALVKKILYRPYIL